MINFRKCIVLKPWGYEYMMFNNGTVDIWVMHLKKGCSTSLHSHPDKKKTLVIMSGKVKTFGKQKKTLKRFDSLVIKKGEHHGQTALTSNVFMMEIETPPNKTNIVRISDSYGRKGKVYEGKNSLSYDFKKFKYVYVEP